MAEIKVIRRLLEAAEMLLAAPKVRWFHGDSSLRNSFIHQTWDRDRSVASPNAHGPGLYFTSSEKEASSYGKFLYEGVCLPGFRLMPKKKPTMRFFLDVFAQANPEDRQTFLDNWNTKNPRQALTNYLQRSPTLHEAAQDLYGDLIRGASDWIQAMVACGYDGALVTDDRVNHLIVFNPLKMQISQIEET